MEEAADSRNISPHFNAQLQIWEMCVFFKQKGGFEEIFPKSVTESFCLLWVCFEAMN